MRDYNLLMRLKEVIFLKSLFLLLKKDLEMAMSNGVMAGYPLNSMKVRLYDGSYHDVDSDQLSFELCAQIAFKVSCQASKS